jgi:hypothetical protein
VAVSENWQSKTALLGHRPRSWTAAQIVAEPGSSARWPAPERFFGIVVPSKIMS